MGDLSLSFLNLSDEKIRTLAPAVFADSRHDSRSEKYTYVSTPDILNKMREEGYGVHSVSQARSLKDKQCHTKHMLRLWPLGTTVGDEIMEILLLNSHDGTSSLQFLCGIYRVVCNNGLTVGGGDLFKYRVVHRGNQMDYAINAALSVAASFPEVERLIGEMKNRMMSLDEKLEFALKGIARRNPDLLGVINPVDMIKSRREADCGDDLWRVYNVVQERIINGGVRYKKNGNRQQLRKLHGIDSVIETNRYIWDSAAAYL